MDMCTVCEHAGQCRRQATEFAQDCAIGREAVSRMADTGQRKISLTVVRTDDGSRSKQQQ